MPDKQHTITVDLTGLKLDDAQFKLVQNAVHSTVLSSISGHGPFAGGIIAKPNGPLAGGKGGLINGIIIERFHGTGGL